VTPQLLLDAHRYKSSTLSTSKPKSKSAMWTFGGVALNQSATVSVDAMPGKQYPGVVTFISPIATVIGNARLYTVHVKLTDVAGLRAGMSARISLNSK
jgi:hypothetical protein